LIDRLDDRLLSFDRSRLHKLQTGNSLAGVLLNDFARLWADAGDDVLAAVGRVGESGWYILGSEVSGFESALSSRMRRAASVGCASGLDAIEIGLRALGLKDGDKVLTTPLSAFATTLAVVRAGGVPVFVDVDERGLLDLDLATEAISSDSSIRFLLPVHLYGSALDLEHLQSVRERFGLRLLEDCAQSIGASHAGRVAGSVGEIAALSFYPTKNLGALGDGGAISADDPALLEKCRVLRDYGQSSKYIHSELGLNSRLDELHAAVLLRAFLPRLDQWTARRREIAHVYLDGMQSTLVRPLPVPAGASPAWHLFAVLVPDRRRDEFLAYLRDRGIQSAVHYPKLISDQQALRKSPFEVFGALSRATNFAECEVSLPIHPYLTDAEVASVVDAVNSWR
jgi:dTDP-3-amino-3,4,6-trideoxy-alpha-D-glucose transaminase